MTLLKSDIRVLVVDDSAFMRKAITIMLESDPNIKVIDTARNGADGVQKVLDLKPDLVTMDIEMPQMDGLTALRKIMDSQPTPVMMISSLTNEGAKVTLDALEMGAVDFIPKQLSYVSLDIVKIKETLLQKIKVIHSRRRTLMANYSLHKRSSKSGKTLLAPGTIKSVKKSLIRKSMDIVAIGTSTGGPPALQKVIPHLPSAMPVGILIVQHMPPHFTRSLAERLNGLSSLHVKEAEHGEPVTAGVAYIAPGDKHMTVRKWGKTSEVQLSDEPSNTLHKPSVDVMMDSIATVYQGRSLGVIMTGMGSDGVNGLRKIKSLGGKIIAQNENSCVVYGMPRAAVDEGLVDKIVPVQNIASEIAGFF
jgi:two-component system, chemotaxis family, protein-glutamate methylesterase/glutaminase